MQIMQKRPEEKKTEVSVRAEVEGSRVMHQSQTAITVAKNFPRDPQRARDMMVAACKSQSFAEVALYEYPKGGQRVTGPSIRMAEMAALNWMNLDFGTRELERDAEKTVMEAYCWDLETNVRMTKVFEVLHQMDTKEGAKRLTSQRDVYENNANMGARRLRACILGVIPGYIMDELVSEVERTLSKNSQPLAQRLTAMLDLFRLLGVSKDVIEKYLGNNVASITEYQMVKLRNIYNSIKDGMGGPESFFDLGKKNQGPGLASLLEDAQETPAVIAPKATVKACAIKPKTTTAGMFDDDARS